MTCAGAPQYFPTVSTTSSRVAILLANPKTAKSEILCQLSDRGVILMLFTMQSVSGRAWAVGLNISALMISPFSFLPLLPSIHLWQWRDHCDACTAFVVPGLHQIYKFAWKCDFAAVEDESRFPEFFRYVFIASMVRRFLGDSAWVFCFICASMPLKELKINNTSIKRIFMFIFLYLCSGSPNFYKVTCFYGSQCNI